MISDNLKAIRNLDKISRDVYGRAFEEISVSQQAIIVSIQRNEIEKAKVIAMEAANSKMLTIITNE